VDEILDLDAVGQAQAVRDGLVSPQELVAAAVARIEARDGELNSVVHRRFDRALAEAADAPEGTPFRGVPTLVKDLGWTMAGEPYTGGSRTLTGVEAGIDATTVTRLRAAGFVVLGRTNTPEFGTSVTTEPALHGPTRNPHDPAYSAGGSSGGSAAAVAAGLVAVAGAGDGGGSIRIPASMCGLVGLKPSRGRISNGPVVGESWGGLATVGLLSRTVRDSAAVLDVLAGFEQGDPYTAPALPGPLAREVGADPGRLRVGFTTAHPRGDVPEDPDLTAAVTRAAALLESLGHQVGPGHPEALGDEAFPDRFAAIVCANLAAEVEAVGAWRGSPVALAELEPFNRVLAELGRAVSAAEHILNLLWIDGYRARMTAWWDTFDLLLVPTLAVAPYRIGWFSADGVEAEIARATLAVSYTAPFNATGQPAISLPLHRTAAGLPVGVQLVAAPGREDVLIRVAAQLESAFGTQDGG
jgi:amidase